MGTDFFDGLGEKISKTARGLSGKAEVVYETQRIKNKTAGEERQAEKIMADLGRALYKRYREGISVEEGQRALCEAIDQRMNEISRLKDELADVRGKKICPSCGNTVDRDACFCPHCGTACPTKEHEDKAGDTVDGTAQEVTTEAETAQAETVREDGAESTAAQAEETAETVQAETPEQPAEEQ